MKIDKFNLIDFRFEPRIEQGITSELVVLKFIDENTEELKSYFDGRENFYINTDTGENVKSVVGYSKIYSVNEKLRENAIVVELYKC